MTKEKTTSSKTKNAASDGKSVSVKPANKTKPVDVKSAGEQRGKRKGQSFEPGVEG